MENDYVDWPIDATAAELDPSAIPNPGPDAVTGLKFSAALPPGLATRTLGERLSDPAGARATAAEPRVHAISNRSD